MVSLGPWMKRSASLRPVLYGVPVLYRRASMPCVTKTIAVRISGGSAQAGLSGGLSFEPDEFVRGMRRLCPLVGWGYRGHASGRAGVRSILRSFVRSFDGFNAVLLPSIPCLVCWLLSRLNASDQPETIPSPKLQFFRAWRVFVLRASCFVFRASRSFLRKAV